MLTPDYPVRRTLFLYGIITVNADLNAAPAFDTTVIQASISEGDLLVG